MKQIALIIFAVLTNISLFATTNTLTYNFEESPLSSNWEISGSGPWFIGTRTGNVHGGSRALAIGSTTGYGGADACIPLPYTLTRGSVSWWFYDENAENTPYYLRSFLGDANGYRLVQVNLLDNGWGPPKSSTFEVAFQGDAPTYYGSRTVGWHNANVLLKDNSVLVYIDGALSLSNTTENAHVDVIDFSYSGREGAATAALFDDLVIVYENSGPGVSNVRAAQRSGTSLFDITYDLVEADTSKLSVAVAISTNDGSTWFFPASSNLTGAVGSFAVSPGLGKTIVWQGGRELPTRVLTSVKVEIAADVPPPQYAGINLSAGTTATSYPVTYYATSNTVPGGANSDAYKTIKLLMRRIPKGNFIMGSPVGELGHNLDETQHPVTLTKDFYIDVFEMTQHQWELVMGNNPSHFNNATYAATRPVECISYYAIRENPTLGADPSVYWPSNSTVNAVSFMGKMRVKTGLANFDLPTESQWEYACRAGTTTALNSGKNLTGTFGSGPGPDANVSEVARYFYNASYGGSDSSVGTNAGTAKVGSYLPNAWGLYDMHGNVWEWCLDWYAYQYSGTFIDPPGPTLRTFHVARGGSWYSDYGGNCRSAERGRGSPDETVLNDFGPDSRIGFRAAWIPPIVTDSCSTDVSLSAIYDLSSSYLSVGSSLELFGITNAIQTSADNSGDGGTSLQLGGVGLLGDSQMAGIQWSVPGPGILSFDWKVSSESNSDWLSFCEVGGAATNQISGTTSDWSRVFVTVMGSTTDVHTFQWQYSKDPANYAGQDSGWVDAINWSPFYSLAVTTNGQGSVDVAPIGTWFVSGSNAVLSASPQEHWNFTSWSGDTNGCLIRGNTITAPMTQARNVVATFTLDSEILTVVSAQGGTNPGTLTTSWGTSVNEWITNSPAFNGTTQYICTGGSVVSNDYAEINPTNITLTLTNNATLTWNWQTQYLLTTTANGPGSVMPSGWYNLGTNVTVTASPVANAYFTGWSGATNGCTLAGNVITVPMTRAESIVANFAFDSETLTVVSSQNGTSPGTTSVSYGSGLTELILNSPVSNGTTQYVCTGAIVAGNSFVQVSPTNVTLTLTNNATLTWLWATNYLLATATNGPGSVTPGGWYAPDSIATLTATARTNAHLANWTGDTNGCLVSGATLTAPMTQARSIQAQFVITTNKTLSVLSDHGGSQPGTTTAYAGTFLSEYQTTTPVLNGATQYLCTGATVKGNNFSLVSPTNVTLTLTNSATLTWQWSTNYWLTITTNGAGSVNPPAGWWPKGSNVQLMATAGDHALFGSWSGQTSGCTIKSNVITAPMTSPRAITANFVRAIVVTATTNPPAGGTVTGGGVYLANTNTITLVATPHTGWRFTGWSDGTTLATHAVIKNLANDTNYVANFVQLGTVTTKAIPTTGGTVTGGGTYDVGTNITLVAHPAASWLFAQWEDKTTNATRSFTVSGNTTCTATFVQGRILTVKASPTTGGSITGGGTYTTNTWATLTATSSNNWRFAKWNDGNTNATRQVLVTATVTYTATFIQQGTLVVQAIPPAGGTATGGGVYDVGSSPTLRAIPNNGWRFGKWSDGNTATSRTTTVTAGTHTNNATFIQQTVIAAVANPADGGTVTGSGTYDTNAVVTLTAKAASANWKFQGWADTISATSPRSVRASVGGASYTGLFTMVTGEIALSTNALAFGPVPVGQSVTQTVAVTNLGPNAIKVSSITVPTGYTAKPTAFTLASNGMTNVTVVFKPTLAAMQTGTVTLVSNAARGAAKVAVNGTGLPATRMVLLTGPLNFGTVKNGTTSNLILTVADNGNSPMIVTALKFSGTGYAQFTLPGLKVPFTVAAGGSTNLTAAFTPTAATTNRATLTATVTSMTTGSTNTLTETGIGVAPVPGAVVKATTGNIVPNGVSTNTPEGFAQWALLHDLAGTPADLFDQLNGDGITYGAQYTFGANLAPGEPLVRVLQVNGVLTAEMPMQDPATLLDACETVEFTRYEGSAIWFPAVCLPPYATTPLTKQWFQAGYGDAADFRVNVRLVK